MTFTWKIGGEAGFGINAAGAVFSKFAARSGYYSFDYIEYPSLVRGGHNALELVIADEEIGTLKEKIDFLVCLNAETYQKHSFRLHDKSVILYDESDFQPEGKGIKINLPFKKILFELGGNLVMRNTVALGASVALLGGDVEILLEILKEQFTKKGEKIIKFNQDFARAGYHYAVNHYHSFIQKILLKKNTNKKLVVSGNEAFSLGAVLADCRFYAAYPMTPSSTVLHTLALWQEKTGMIVRHAEDEISVINQAIGASFAGVRSAVGTSGGGFALMVESVSFAGIAEIPLVVFLAQRPGPATGMPTWTEQGDLLFAIFAGHGEFPKIVLAPSDHLEMIQLTAEAFNLADIYQTPVIVLSDMFLSESHRTIDEEKISQLANQYQINRGKLIKDLPKTEKIQPFLRYQMTQDGISPRLLPGTSGYFYQANSYEHLEDSHTTEEALERKKQVEKRNRKIQTYLKNHFQKPKIYGDLENASLVFVSWGSNKEAILAAIKELQEENQIDSALIHFSYLYPLDKEILSSLFNQNKQYILIENNSFGQLGRLLSMSLGIEIGKKILRYDGRPITSYFIIEELKKNGDIK